MRQLQKLVLCMFLGLATGLTSVQSAPHEMKTHSSTVKAAKVTVVHFGAPW